MLEEKAGREISPSFDAWRPGDQKIFVSDISKVSSLLGWQPGIDKERGVGMLWDWVSGHKDIFEDL